jgi:hypothetical protein
MRPSRYSHRQVFSSNSSATKTNHHFQTHKNELPMEWNAVLKERAQKLIFGSRKYPEFTEEEKKIVDFYQQKILEVDGGVVLPNTGLDLEQHQAGKEFLKKRKP